MNIKGGYFTLMQNDMMTSNLNWNTDVGTLKYFLDHRLRAYGDAQIVRIPLGADGNPTDSTTVGDILGYQFDITFAKHRGSQVDKKPFLVAN